MKRALAICAATMVLGWVGFGISISGHWSTDIDVLPDMNLYETSLTLGLTTAGWDLASRSVFAGPDHAWLAEGFAEQTFQASGQLGLASVSGLMVFDPIAVEYSRAYLRAGVALMGFRIDLGWYHGSGWNYRDPGMGLIDYYGMVWYGTRYGVPYSFISKPGYANILDDLGPMESVFLFDFTMDPLFARVWLIDRHQVITIMVPTDEPDVQTESEVVINAWGFGGAIFQLLDVDLCCGVTFDTELSFTKADGFKHLKVAFENLVTLMDMFTLDILITYGVDSKSVRTKWDFVGFPGTVCLDIYADAEELFKFDLHGFGITCTLADCNSITFGTAFLAERTGFVYLDTAQNVYFFSTTEGLEDDADIVLAGEVDYYGHGAAIPAEWDLNGDFYYDGEAEKLYSWVEFETVQLSLCGPACCGGVYQLAVAMYWAEFWTVDLDADPVEYEEVNPTLFGLSRVAFDGSVPLMENFSINLGFSYTLLPEETELTFGWTFTF